MKSFHTLVFDDIVDSTTPAYTDPSDSELMASTETLEVFVVASQASIATTLTVRCQISGDNQNWLDKGGTIPVDNRPLSADEVTVYTGVTTATEMTSGFVRLMIIIGGASTRARVRIHVTGRGETVVAARGR